MISDLLKRLIHLWDVELGESYIDIVRWDGNDLNPPVRLHVSEASLAAAVDHFTAESVGSFGNTTPRREIGWNLLLVDLEEAISTRGPGRNELFLTEFGTQFDPDNE